MSIGSRTATVVENASTQSITATLPTDRQSGDLVVAVFVMNGAPANFTGPGGSWVALVSPTSSPDANTFAAYYQFTPGSAPTCTTTATAGRASAICQAYSGVNTSTPVDVAAATATTGGSPASSLAVGGITTVTDGARLISACVVDSSSATFTAAPTGMTMVGDASGGGVGRGMAVADEVDTTAGATGTRTWSQGGGNLGMGGLLGALRPSGGVTGDVSQAVTAATTATGTLAAVGAVTSAVTAGVTAAGATGRPQFVQDNEAGGTTGATSITVTSSNATAGNILWVAYGGDKDAGTITGPTGFTEIAKNSSTSVSFGLWYKVAAGGENSFTVTRSIAPPSTDRLWVGEFSQTGTGAWSIRSSATHYTDESTVTSWASGTAADPGRSCAAIAAFGIDSGGSATSGQAFSNSFTELNPYGATGAGIAVGWKDLVTAGATVSTTHSYTGTADQISAAIATFTRIVEHTGAVTSAVTASTSADGTVTAGGVTGGATQAITASTTATGKLAAVGAATAQVTASVSAAGFVGVHAAATSQTTATTTAAGFVGVHAAATSQVTASTSVAGDVAAPAFPLSPLPITVLLRVNGAWEDITTYVYGRDQTPISITRGRASEQSSPERSTMSLHLNNRDGRFSPRNPTGPYYGQLTRNTQMAVIVEEGGPYLDVPSTTDARASAADTAGLSITGDLDVRIDLDADDWTTSGDMIAKYTGTSTNRSWLFLLTSGKLKLSWSPDGTLGAVQQPQSTINVPMDGPGRLAVRATLDVDNGAGGWTVTFYTASTIAGPWRQLGRQVTGIGVTSIHDSATAVTVGDASASAFGPLPAKVFSAQVRSGIDGTVVASPAFEDQILAATNFFDDQGNEWTLSGGVSLANTWTRITGEVSEWPQKWDISGSDAWVPVSVCGVMRRLGQGQSPVQSTFRSALPARADLVAYWPCEDGASSTSVAAGSPDTRPLTVSDNSTAGSTGALRFAASNTFPCSLPLPVMGTGRFDGTVPAATATGELQFTFLLSVASGGGTDASQIAKIYTTGTAAKWILEYGTFAGGSIRVAAYSSSDAELFVSGYTPLFLDGRPGWVSFDLTQDGADIDWAITNLPVNSVDGLTGSGTLTGRTVGSASRFVIGKHNDLGTTALGHIMIENNVTSIFSLRSELNAWRYETAGRRMARLCAENGMTFVPYGDLDATAEMGHQGIKTFLDLMKECALADGGILAEPAHTLGLSYRTRDSIERQNPRVSLSYPGHQMTDLEPVEDDRAVRNLVKVNRENGTSRTAELTSGAMSTADPPDGIGKYDTSVTLSLAADEDVEHQAHWRLSVGTVDEARYPTLRVNLASAHLTADQGMVRDVMAVEVGDRVDVTGPPIWVPPDDIRQIVQGYTEKLGQYLHEITWNLGPEAPYRVAVFDDDTSRYSSDGSTLTADVTSAATSLSVTTADGPVWTHDDGDFDVMVGGERMTVTAVTGASSPQTFTVTRAVNGVVKAHSTGAAVDLFEPYLYTL